MSREDLSHNLSKDTAKKITAFFKSRKDYFSFSSLNRTFRKFFEVEREMALKTPRISVRKNQASAFLHTFEGKLYASGALLGEDRFDERKEKFHKWTSIGPRDKKISEFIFGETKLLFVRCEQDWYQLGNNISEWTEIRGPDEQKIISISILDPSLSMKPKIYICCEDGFWYSCLWDQNKIADWAMLKLGSRKILEVKIYIPRIFICCEDGWFASGGNRDGELGIGKVEDPKDWIKLGPPDKVILKLKANNYNTIIYCDDGRWYGCGGNFYGQLGTGEKESQYNWRALGRDDMQIETVFLEDRKIYLSCSDGLYASGYNYYGVFGTGHHANLFTWTKIGFSNKKIIQIIESEKEAFVRCDEGWYGAGNNKNGNLGLGDQLPRDRWEKLTCQGKEILQLVPSNEYTFASCEDAWYFAGNNKFGPNGIDDDCEIRTRWIKILDHGVDIEAALTRVAHVKNEPKPIGFRRALKKLYELDIIASLENTAFEIARSRITICYHEEYPYKNTFYFLLPVGNSAICYAFHELECRIQEIIDYPSFIIKTEGYIGFRYPHHRAGGYPDPSLSVRVSGKNYAAICEFLTAYESILDQQESLELESSVQLKI